MKAYFIAIGVGIISSPAFAQIQPQSPPSGAQVLERQILHDIRRPNHNTFQNNYDSKVLLEKQFKEPGAAYNAAYVVADCLAKKAGRDAGPMLGGPLTTDPNYEALVKALSGRKYNRCLKEESTGVPMNVVNGALAESMLESEGLDLAERATKVDVTKAQSFYADASGPSLESVARCLAVYSPGLAMKVLAVGAGTADEKTAMAQLFAKSPECGYASPPDNFTVDEQRSAVAASLYQWLHRG